MNTYKSAEFVEVGRTYYIPSENSQTQYRKAIVLKILREFAIVKSNGEEFSVPFSDLYFLE